MALSKPEEAPGRCGGRSLMPCTGRLNRVGFPRLSLPATKKSGYFCNVKRVSNNDRRERGTGTHDQSLLHRSASGYPPDPCPY